MVQGGKTVESTCEPINGPQKYGPLIETGERGKALAGY